MKKTKLLALILAALMLSSSFLACSDKDVKDTEAESSSDSESETVDEAFVSATTYYQDMPAIDFDGWSFNCAGGYGDAGSAKGVTDHITMDALTGDEFSDDLYNRVVAINDKYNITFTTDDSDVAKAVKLSVVSGTEDYVLGSDLYDGLSALILSDYVKDVNTVQTVNLDNPYWDQGAREYLTINDRMFYIMSDASFSHYDSAALLFYNGLLLTDNQITDSPYVLYKEGKWTMEAMWNMMETVASDLDGDGKYTEGSDILGLTGRTLIFAPQLNGSGTDTIVWNEEEMTYNLNLSNEIVMEVGEWCRKMIVDSEISVMDKDYDTFKKDKSLFLSLLLGSYRSMRDKEDDYGIVPWPSIQENMETRVHVRNPTALIIPSGLEEETADNVGIIVEALAAYSYDYIIEDYITRAVIGKGARDQESADIIRDIMDKRAYDIKSAFGITSVDFAWENSIKKGTYVSMEKTVEKAFRRSVDKALAPYVD